MFLHITTNFSYILFVCCCFFLNIYHVLKSILYDVMHRVFACDHAHDEN